MIGDYRTALKLYTDALEANPTDTAAIFYTVMIVIIFSARSIER